MAKYPARGYQARGRGSKSAGLLFFSPGEPNQSIREMVTAVTDPRSTDMACQVQQFWYDLRRPRFARAKATYGRNPMLKPKGFSLIELLIVIAIILVIAAIAIPNLLRARMAANDSSAAGSMHTINVAEAGYFGSYETVGFPATLASLGGAQERLQLCGHRKHRPGKPHQQPVLCYWNPYQRHDRHPRLLLLRRSGDPPPAGGQHHSGCKLCGVPGPVTSQ
jgi:prepilin-type N-terminal cleavage/methylation domain-containing protein